jgi:hypothetical protein
MIAAGRSGLCGPLNGNTADDPVMGTTTQRNAVIAAWNITNIAAIVNGAWMCAILCGLALSDMDCCAFVFTIDLG